MLFFRFLICFYGFVCWINLDSMCILIAHQVCFHSATKYENDVSDIIGWFQIVRIYSFTKEINIYKHALCVIILVVKLENNYSLTEIKHVFCIFIALRKLGNIYENSLSRSKCFIASQIFNDLLSNSPKHSPWFSLDYEAKLNLLRAKWPMEMTLISSFCSVYWMRGFDSPWTGH